MHPNLARVSVTAAELLNAATARERLSIACLLKRICINRQDFESAILFANLERKKTTVVIEAQAAPVRSLKKRR